MAKAVKLSDIAAKIGVSTVTVSKALSGQKGMSDELRDRIVVLADEMGYVKRVQNKEKEAVFKSYLRRLMRDLIDLKKAIKEKNLEEAERLIDDLIEDTQKDIED